MKERKFDYGQVVMTRAVADRVNESTGFSRFTDICLIRHLCGDWGDLCEEDAALNDEAVEFGDRILSAYIYEPTNEKIWIITEADRSVTTLLFPSDY